VTRLMLEVTNLDSGETKYITVGGTTEVPDLVAGDAPRDAPAQRGRPTETVPHSIALWPGGDEQDDDAA
jgi:hypothetical protein